MFSDQRIFLLPRISAEHPNSRRARDFGRTKPIGARVAAAPLRQNEANAESCATSVLAGFSRRHPRDSRASPPRSGWRARRGAPPGHRLGAAVRIKLGVQRRPIRRSCRRVGDALGPWP
jgi:hypothetical protein